METLILTHREVRALCDMELAMGTAEEAFRAYAEGRARMPAKVYLDLPEFDADLCAMPSLLGGYAGVKWVNAHPQNRERRGLPTVMGAYVLNDPASGFPLALLDATLLTALRTGAAAGVATKYLANRPFDRVGFIGCGAQARMFRDAHRTLGAFEVWAADTNLRAAEAFATESGGCVVSVEQAASCSVVCIATPSRKPVVERAWIAAGTHINAMGADGPGKQELDPQILRDAHIVVDATEQSLHSGELNVPVVQGLLSATDIAATLGEVIAGKAGPRRTPRDITVFDSTGLAIQDVALAAAIYERARERGVGQAVELVPTG